MLIFTTRRHLRQRFGSLFADIVAGWRKETRGAPDRALARHVGIHESRLSHMRAGEGAATQRIDLWLRLARASGLPANEVLTRAGREDTLALIQEHFGPPNRVAPVGFQTTDREQQFLVRFRRLDANERAALEVLLLHMIQGKEPPPDATSPSRRSGRSGSASTRPPAARA